MLGWIRRRKKDRPNVDSGLLYAGSRAEERPAEGPAGPGGKLSTRGTDRGPLEFRDRAMVLETDDGRITIPYHTIEAWDDAGKRFRVWWSDNGRDYTMSCIPEKTPAGIGAELRDGIRRNTFG